MKIGVFVAALMAAMPLAAQTPDAEAVKAEQREKQKPFAWMDGIWRGDATVTTQQGSIKLTQTERVGPMLDGTTRMIEGRGYKADGTIAFNALAVIVWNSGKKAHEIHAFSEGRVGVFPLTPTADGFVWETPAGPGVVRYTATFKNGVWREIGEFTMAGRPAFVIIDMSLKRVGNTDWPLTVPIPAK